MAVAHGVFWKYHPATAYRWELRLQDEIGPDFRIEEAGSDAAREAFLREHAKEAQELRAAEEIRRERKKRKDAPDLFDTVSEDESNGEDDGDEA